MVAGGHDGCVNANIVELKNANTINPELQVVEGIEGGRAAADVINGDAMVQGESANNHFNSSEIGV